MQIIKRKTKTGKARYMCRVHGFKSRTFTFREDAVRWGTEMERRKQLGELYEEPSPTFKARRQDYVRRHAAGWSDGTRRTYRQTIAMLKPLDELLLEDVTREQVETLITGMAPTTARKALKFVKRVLKDAQENRSFRNRVDLGVYSIKPPAYEKRPLRFLTWEQVEELASWMPEFVHRIVLVAALTGMRQGELFRLKDSDLHLDDGYLWVQRGKTDNARRKVHLGADAVLLLREQLVRRPRGCEIVFPAPLAGTERAGAEVSEMLDTNHFMHRYFRPARDAAGLDKDVTFHSLRHTFVSIAASRGVRSDTIAKMAGWSPQSWQLMYSHYRHFFADEAPAEAAKMTGLLSSTGTAP